MQNEPRGEKFNFIVYKSVISISFIVTLVAYGLHRFGLNNTNKSDNFYFLLTSFCVNYVAIIYAVVCVNAAILVKKNKASYKTKKHICYYAIPFINITYFLLTLLDIASTVITTNGDGCKSVSQRQVTCKQHFALLVSIIPVTSLIITSIVFDSLTATSICIGIYLTCILIIREQYFLYYSSYLFCNLIPLMAFSLFADSSNLSSDMFSNCLFFAFYSTNWLSLSLLDYCGRVL